MTKRWRYGAGIITATKNNTFGACVSLGHRQRKRKVLKTMAQAKAWILAQSSVHTDVYTYTDEGEARAMLPDDITLVEAVRFWLQHHPQESTITISQLWEAFAKANTAQLRPRTLQSYRQSFARLRVLCSDCIVSHLSRERIESALADTTPTRRNGILRDLNAVMNWAVAERLIATNPASDIRKAKTAQAMPQAFKVEEVQAIMLQAEQEHPQVVPALALGFFAGLRPNEISRLAPSMIANGFIILPPQVTKTAQARNVPIRPNLAGWLQAYPFTGNKCGEREIKAFRRAYTANGAKWYADGARHSFATYAYELTKDASQVASEMGHTSTQIFFRHYRAMACPNSGKAYFQIAPKLR